MYQSPDAALLASFNQIPRAKHIRGVNQIHIASVDADACRKMVDHLHAFAELHQGVRVQQVSLDNLQALMLIAHGVLMLEDPN